MSFATSTPIQSLHYGDGSAASGEQQYQVLEVRMRYIRRLITGSPSAGVGGVPYQILHESAPTPLENVLFPLPLHELNDPMVFQIYVAQLLSSLSIRAAYCEVIARQIASYVFQTTAGDREANLHIVADVDYIQATWMGPISGLYQRRSNGGAVVEETVILEEAPPVRRGVPESAMERLRTEKLEENNEEQMGDCSICLDEMNCKEREVIKIPCGHIYHKSCIFQWLNNNNSCPLCRRPLPLED